MKLEARLLLLLLLLYLGSAQPLAFQATRYHRNLLLRKLKWSRLNLVDRNFEPLEKNGLKQIDRS